MRRIVVAGLAAIAMTAGAQVAHAAEAGMITKPSNFSVQDTVSRFAKGVSGRDWVMFAEIDHAAAAAKTGLSLPPRTVLVFGNPRTGTAPMQKAPTLAIDLPMKALVWQDDQGKVWLTYNSGEYLGAQIFPRHGLAMPEEGRKQLDAFLAQLSDEATR